MYVVLEQLDNASLKHLDSYQLQETLLDVLGPGLKGTRDRESAALVLNDD